MVQKNELCFDQILYGLASLYGVVLLYRRIFNVSSSYVNVGHSILFSSLHNAQLSTSCSDCSIYQKTWKDSLLSDGFSTIPLISQSLGKEIFL